MPSPSAEELTEAVRQVKEKNPDFGIKRVLGAVKEGRSDWEVSEKRVKKILQDLDASPSAASPAAASAAPEAAAEASAAPAEWVQSARPSPRGYFSITALEGGEAAGRALVFGGEFYDNKRNLFYNDLFEVDTATGAYRAPSFGANSNLPPSRSAHQACVVGGFVYVFGGESSAPNGQKFKLHSDLWRCDVAAPRWEKIGAAGGASGRSGHRMVAVGGRLVLYGGMGDSRYFGDLHIFDPAQGKWLTKVTQLATQKSQKSQSHPGPRSGFAMWADGTSGAYVWGGTREKGRGTEALSDLWRLDTETLAWEKLEPAGGGGPGPRSGVGVAVAGRLGVLFGGVTGGGEGGDTFHEDAVALDMDKRSWVGVGGGGLGGRRNAGLVACGGGLVAFGGLREEGDGKREKEVTLDDLWGVDVGEGGVLGAWRSVLKRSGEGDWVDDDDVSSGGEEEG